MVVVSRWRMRDQILKFQVQDNKDVTKKNGVTTHREEAARFSGPAMGSTFAVSVTPARLLVYPTYATVNLAVETKMRRTVLHHTVYSSEKRLSRRRCNDIRRDTALTSILVVLTLLQQDLNVSRSMRVKTQQLTAITKTEIVRDLL